MAIKLPRLPSSFKLINADGSPTSTFQLWWQNVAGQLEVNINAVLAALEAADIAVAAAESAQASADAADAAASAAQTAADSAQDAATANAQELSISNSGVINEVAAFEADDLGNVTVPDHIRAYGNPALNPSVSVIGNNVGTGGIAGQLFFIGYDDPTRAGGAVTYGFTDDPAGSIQSGSWHSIGSVTIPAAGTQAGSLTRPRGV